MDLKTTETNALYHLLKHIAASAKTADEKELGFLASFGGDIIAEINGRFDRFALDCGLHQDADGRTMYDVSEYRGVPVVRTWDRLDGGEGVDIRFRDEVCPFNSIRDAEAWIDEQIDESGEEIDPEGRPWR